MDLKRIGVVFLVAILMYVGFQAMHLTIAYVQVQNIVESKAHEARIDHLSAEEIRAAIVDHMNTTNTDLPYDMVIGVTGLEYADDTVRIELKYTAELNLHVWVLPIDLTVVGTADPPQE